MERAEYELDIVVNGVRIERVIIDPHYKEKHSESINDEIILNLVRTLDGKYYDPEDVKGSWSYFVVDQIEWNGKMYRLIWLMEEKEFYVGVVNAYRR